MEKEIYNWYEATNINNIVSPALLVYPDRVEANIIKMIEAVRDVNRLRPHVKTHKMSEIIKLQISRGIKKFKCSTIAEAEMTASSGASDVLLAMQPVGPNIDRFFGLMAKFPSVKFSCLADNETTINQLAEKAAKSGVTALVWIDINNGMNRTGITPADTLRFFDTIISHPMIKVEGLHAYDGHIKDTDFAVRKQKSDEAFEPVLKIAEVINKSHTPLKIIVGGSPTFTIHAQNNNVECSPGTVLLWDYGYGSTLPDTEFLHAAVIMTRVVSKPAEDIISLDLGHKALGSEMPHPRINFLGINDFTMCVHSEEHLVIKTPMAKKLMVGDVLYGIPWHICPTVDRYDFAEIVKNNSVITRWAVEARKRMITI